MRSFGPRDYRPLHLETHGAGRVMRPARAMRLNPASPIALLFASLVVAAHSDARGDGRGDGRMGERGGDRPFERPAPDAVPEPGSPPVRTGIAPAQDCVPALWRRAIADGRADELGRLLARRPDAGLPDASATDGRTALMIAAMTDDLPLARALMRAGARPDRSTGTGGTALMFCSLGTRLDVARALHAAGARIELPAANGWTALTIAAARGHLPMIDWLLSVGAPPAPVDVYGCTPLMRAVDDGHVEAAARLLEAGPDALDRSDARGDTALHRAASQGSEAMVRLLVVAGADAGAVNRDGATPADVATGSVAGALAGA